jgi:hypothetical protein
MAKFASSNSSGSRLCLGSLAGAETDVRAIRKLNPERRASAIAGPPSIAVETVSTTIFPGA